MLSITGSTRAWGGRDMKSKIRSFLLVFFLAMFSAVANAACYAYYCNAQILTMIVTDTGVLIRLHGDAVGLTNCTPEQGYYLTLPKSNPNYASYYAALLAAYHTKDSVTLRPVDGSTGCLISYIAIP
jgi:hypothetical protein